MLVSAGLLSFQPRVLRRLTHNCSEARRCFDVTESNARWRDTGAEHPVGSSGRERRALPRDGAPPRAPTLESAAGLEDLVELRRGDPPLESATPRHVLASLRSTCSALHTHVSAMKFAHGV